MAARARAIRDLTVPSGRLERRDRGPNDRMTLVRLGAILRIRGGDAERHDVAAPIFLGHHAQPPTTTKVVVTKVGGDLEKPGLERRVA